MNWIRCWQCGHRGEPYSDIDGTECMKCGHPEFDWIDPEHEADKTVVTALEPCESHQASDLPSKAPALEVRTHMRKTA